MPTWPLEKVEEFGQFVSLGGAQGEEGGKWVKVRTHMWGLLSDDLDTCLPFKQVAHMFPFLPSCQLRALSSPDKELLLLQPIILIMWLENQSELRWRKSE